MRRARSLLGLPALSIAVAVGCTEPKPAAPLRDVQGAPACGNVGQVGRPHDPGPIAGPTAPVGTASTVAAASTVGTTAAPATRTVTRSAPTRARPARPGHTLLGRGPAGPVPATPATPTRPLTDRGGRPASGNVMGKGDPYDRGEPPRADTSEQEKKTDAVP